MVGGSSSSQSSGLDESGSGIYNDDEIHIHYTFHENNKIYK